MSNNYKTAAKTYGLNVEGNEVVLPEGSLAVADNALIDRDNIIEQRFGFDLCNSFLPVSKPESLFVSSGNLFVNINNQLWYLRFPDACIYSQINGLSSAYLNQPNGIYYFNNKLLFTEHSHIVRSFDFGTLYVGLIAGLSGVPGTANGTGNVARFDSPSGIFFDASGIAYVCDTNNYTIRAINLSTNTVSTIAGLAGTSGSADGIGAAARFNSPSGIWGDGTYLYITDTSNQTIRRLDIATNNVTTIAGMAGVSGSSDGIGAAARFHAPNGIWGSGNNLFIVDELNYTIRKMVISTSNVTTIAGTAGVSGSADGIGAAARFSNPQCITGDSSFLYMTDSGNLGAPFGDGGYTVRKIQLSNNNVTTLCGQPGTGGSIDGTGSSALFNRCVGITCDSTYLYVCDEQNQAIRRVDKVNGQVTFMIGDSSVSSDTDGVVLTILSGPNG